MGTVCVVLTLVENWILAKLREMQNISGKPYKWGEGISRIRVRKGKLEKWGQVTDSSN
jgi:hypothetical protein